MTQDETAIPPQATGTIKKPDPPSHPLNRINNPDTWKSLSKFASFNSDAERQWWNDAGAMIARCLNIAKGDIHEQYQYLLFVREIIIPAMGPYPPIRRSCINITEIGLELSLNFQGPGAPVFRVCVDPVSTITGTPMDPLNIDTVNNIVTRLAAMDLKGFDRTLFYHFTSEFAIPETKAKTYHAETKEPVPWSQTVLAFDFKDGDIVTKQYIYTRHAAHASGLHPHALIRRAISRVDDQMRCSTAVNLVLEYMETCNGDIPVPFFSWDLVDPSQSRLKLYGISWQWSFAKVEEVCTLGGKVHGPSTDRSIDLLKRLWDILKLDESKPSMGFTWNYEICPGQAQPNVRIYFAISDRSDAEIARDLAQWFKLLGWEETARSYPETLRYLQ